MDVLHDSQVYVSASVTYAIGADRPWGGSVAGSGRVPLAEGGVAPELGVFVRVDVSLLDGYQAAFGPVVGVMSAERADSRYLPYAQLDLGAGLQLGSAPPAALLDLGVSKALNPYLSHPQTSSGNGLGAFSVRADAAISLPLVGDSKRGAADSATTSWKGPAHPVRVGLGGQMAVLPVEWLLES